MTTTKTRAPRPRKTLPAFSSEDVAKILELVKGSSSVEMKLSVPDAGHRAAIQGIRLDPVEAQPRQAFFFDTPDLALYKAGVVVRARRIQGGRADTVVKLRPVDPATIDAELRRSASFKVEVDVMPGGYVCSASYKGVCSGKDVLDVTAGTAQVQGAVVAENSLTVAGTPVVLRQAATLDRLQRQQGSLVRVPGSWRDFVAR